MNILICFVFNETQTSSSIQNSVILSFKLVRLLNKSEEMAGKRSTRLTANLLKRVDFNQNSGSNKKPRIASSSNTFELVMIRGANCRFCSFMATIPELVDKHVAENHPGESKKYFVLKSLQSSSSPENCGVITSCSQCQYRTTDLKCLIEHKRDKHRAGSNSPQKKDYTTINTNGNISSIKSERQRRKESNMDLLCLKKLAKNPYWTARPELNRRRFKCQRCIQSFDSRVDLRTHVHQTNSGHRLFVCLICLERYESKSCLIHHLGHDHLPQHLRCVLCHEPKEHCIQSHTDYIYSTKEKNYNCPVCDKSFCKQTSLKRHLGKY